MTCARKRGAILGYRTQITIASLPATLPARLIARLHEIDSNGDGIVTKAEAKAWEHAHKHDRGVRH